MAQMTITIADPSQLAGGHTHPRSQLCAMALTLALMSMCVQASVPEAALRAEQNQNWAEAAQVYRAHLKPQANDIDSWRRLSEVEAKAGNTNEAAAALGEIAKLEPYIAEHHAQHSRALAMANDKYAALAAINRAVALQPDQLQYLLAQAQLANWNGEIALAEQALARYDQLAKSSTDHLDDLARVRAWQARYAEADALLAQYLNTHADDQEAWLDRVRIMIWRGDYAQAEKMLQDFTKRFGEKSATTVLRARNFAWAGRLDAAQEINASALAKNAQDYDANFTQAIALRQTQRPIDALHFLDEVLRQKPNAKETTDLARGTRLPMRSRAHLNWDRYEDSDDIQIEQWHLGAKWRFADATWLYAQVGERDYQAPLAGSYAPIGGGDSIVEKRVNLSVMHALNGDHAVTASIGHSSLQEGDLQDRDSIGSWQMNWQARWRDDWAWQLGAQRDRIGVSPRAMSLGITRRGFDANVTWTPNLRWRIDAFANLASQSDDNNLREFALTAMRHSYRGSRFNLDLGATTWFTHFAEQLGNGYYDPDAYRRLQAVASGYFKINDDHGINLYLASGVQRDETLSNWKGANDAAIEGILGIFSDWNLRLRATYTDRRQAAGAFDARNFGVTIERRF